MKLIHKYLSSGYTKGWTRTPWSIVIHYTATFTEQSTYNIFKKRNLSVHSCIERNGNNYRYLLDSDRGWHAGHSTWGGQSNLNHHALGIEVVNFGWIDGKLTSSEHKVYRNPNKNDPEVNPSSEEWYRDETYKNSAGKQVTTRVVTKQGSVQAKDHRKAWRGKYWTAYPQEQILSVCEQSWRWMKEYNILPENVVGHEHISPDRKTDPGPAFPWKNVNAYLIKRAEKELPKLIDPGFNSPVRIKAVQSQCARMGLPVGDIDGYWGDKTDAAVKMAYDKYGSFYALEPMEIKKANVLHIALAFKRIPGFDPGRN